MKKLTPWFPSHVKPARPGVYETCFDNDYEKTIRGFSFWSGVRWSNQADSIRSVDPEIIRRAIQQKQWRGLAVKP